MVMRDGTFRWKAPVGSPAAVSDGVESWPAISADRMIFAGSSHDGHLDPSNGRHEQMEIREILRGAIASHQPSAPKNGLL